MNPIGGSWLFNLSIPESESPCTSLPEPLSCDWINQADLDLNDDNYSPCDIVQLAFESSNVNAYSATTTTSTSSSSIPSPAAITLPITAQNSNSTSGSNPSSFSSPSCAALRTHVSDKSCTELATQALQALHEVPSGLCLSSNIDSMVFPPETGTFRCPTRTTDAVMTDNFGAAQAIRSILSCPSCCIRPQIQFQAAALMERALIWYRILIKSTYNRHDPGKHSPSSSSSSTDLSSKNPRLLHNQSEQVLCQPITIGDHALEKALEMPVIAVMIRGRIRELEGLVETISIRTREGGDRHRTPCPREVDLMEILSVRLVHYLNSQIRIVRKELLCLGER